METPKAQCRVAFPIAAIGFLVITTACDPAVKTQVDEHQNLLSGIRASYDTYFQLEPPEYVVVTYPESSSTLPRYGQDVFRIVMSVLASRKIPYECLKLEDALTTVTDRRKNEYKCYRIPEPMTARPGGGTLLYINLCMDQDLKTKKHPLAAEHEITVRIWNDEYTKDRGKKVTM